MKEKLCAIAAGILDCNPDEMIYENRQARNVHTGRTVSLEKISVKDQVSNNIAAVATATHSSPVSPPPYMVGMVEIELDRFTGETKILNYTAVADCGIAINPALARVQVEGGIVQGIGHTLFENVTYDRNGRLNETNFMQYKIPTRLDMGQLHVEFENSYEETGPFGAKSLGEIVINTPAPAIAHAIYRATGVWHRELPITLLDILKEQKASKYSGGIYHKTQIDLTYNSNHMEGSRLTHDQTRYIFETNTIGVEKEVLNVDDVIETANHFRCIDMIIDHAKAALTEKFIKELHLVLKNGTSDSRKDWFAVGDYKKLPNEVGGRDTALPEEVADKMKALLAEYNAKEEKNFEDILDFHVKFERIHPFQDGNGRVGRLTMFKECLKYNIVPFIIEDNLKMFYYRGLKEWDNEKGYLTDTCLTAQDKYKAYLDYFRIKY